MNNYETIFIMNPNITEEQRKEVISKVEKYINENGKITNKKDIGKRKLAYEINKNSHGDYYLIELECEPKVIYELERIYRITDEIMKFITIKKDN